MALVQRLQSELGVNTTCGASNVSFGLPNRPTINAGFLAMAIGAGLTSAITNALDPEVRQMVRAADVLTGNDPNCTTWITHNRPPDTEEEGAGRRRTNRRRGRGPGARTRSGNWSKHCKPYRTRWTEQCRARRLGWPDVSV